MSIKAVVANSSSQSTLHKVVVNNLGGVLTPASPFAVKNEIGENIAIAAVDQLVDLELTNKVNTAVPIYNAGVNKYQVRPLTYDDVSGTVSGGSF